MGEITMKKRFLAIFVVLMFQVICVGAVFAAEEKPVTKGDKFDASRKFIDIKIAQDFAAMKCPDLEKISPAIMKFRFREVVGKDGGVAYTWFRFITSKVSELSNNNVVVLLDDTSPFSIFNAPVVRFVLVGSEKALRVEISRDGKLSCDDHDVKPRKFPPFEWEQNK